MARTDLQWRAGYRVIRKYVKSRGRYVAEKSRRKRAVALQAQGLSRREIGEQLGVSLSTVTRDLRKVSRCRKGKWGGVGGGGLASVGQRRWSHRGLPECRRLIITVDADAALRGCRSVGFKPDLPVRMRDHSGVTFELIVGGRKLILGRVYVSDVYCGVLKFDVYDDSIRKCVKSALAGLRVVDNLAFDACSDYSI